ncbi:MAG TPA: class I SAM-dependent methyltransferase [Ktedonobacterales bacterium]|nr:class I SAM-dependent methyltransferase [Ktedonobacterales bacterium]
MRFFFWRKPLAEPTSPSPRPQRWTWLSGRRILTNTPYVMPKDAEEGSRLDLQHHLLKIAAGGLYRAPLRQPRSILDVACGTGIWGREMAQEFPRAHIIGFDIDASLPEKAIEILGPGGRFPQNFRFQVGDALKAFPFDTGSFDFVHARLISPFVPIARWPDVVREMMRVLKPGGVIELVDLWSFPRTPSPAFQPISKLGEEFFAERGLFVGVGDALPELLAQAGAQQVQQRTFVLGNDPRQARLLAADMLAGQEHIKPLLVQRGQISAQEFDRLHAQAKVEVPQMGIQMPFVFAFGKKI